MYEIAEYTIKRVYPEEAMLAGTSSLIAIAFTKFAKNVSAWNGVIILDITKNKTIVARACTLSPDETTCTAADGSGEVWHLDAGFEVNHASPTQAIQSASPRIYSSPPGIRDWMGIDSLVKRTLENVFTDQGYSKVVADYDYAKMKFVVHADSAIAGQRAGTARTGLAKDKAGGARGPKVVSKRLANTWLHGRT